MRRNTSHLLGLLLVVYFIGQSIVLFYGHTMRMTLFTTKRDLHNQYSKSSFVSHKIFDDKTVGGAGVDSVAGSAKIVKLGSSDKYINVDLLTVKDVTQKSKVYSNFQFELPRFIDNRSLELFLKKKDNHLDALVRTPQQLYGELYIVRNGTYDTNLDCGYKSSNTWVKKDRKVAGNNWFDMAAPLIVPDGHTFQHFIDGTLPKIVQALPVLQDRRVKIIMRSLRDKIIFEMFDRLNISRDQLVFNNGGTFGANYLIYPCITPPVHPDLWQEGRRLLGGHQSLQVPYEQALVIFVTRKGCHNCGRRVLNDEVLIEMLQKRYGADKVHAFSGPQTLANSVDLFSKARIIMGPHGGGMYNINFAPSKTTVIEFMPTKSSGEVAAAAHQIIWTMAQLQGQEYWRMCIQPTGTSDMNVDLNELSKILDVADTRGGS